MLPAHGRDATEVLAELERLRAHDTAPVRAGSAAWRTAERAYLAMLDVDGLEPLDSPSVLALEREVIAAVAEKLGGDRTTPGIVAGGGTESIILAAKAARDSRPDVARPRMAVPVTAHGAFHKAGAYLGIALDTVAVDPATCRPDPEGMAAAMAGETVLVGVSAPSAGHGVIDPVPEIASLAEQRGIACHVDACAGWILPWMADAGAEIPPFDLSVPGVTSLSCDLHKFGDVPKGVSVLLFRSAALRRAAYYACARWSGYTLVTPTVHSSRSAGPLAAAWAALEVTGAAGYAQLGDQILRATTAFRRHAEQRLPDLEMLGRSHGPVVSVTARDPRLDLFALCEAARASGVPVSAQAAICGLPHNLRLSLSRVETDAVLGLIEALRAAIDTALASPGPVTDPAVVAAVSALDLDGVDDAEFAQLLHTLGVFADGNGDGSAVGVAAVNRLLCALPARSREAGMLRFLAAR